jgi:hypothetical protein
MRQELRGRVETTPYTLPNHWRRRIGSGEKFWNSSMMVLVKAQSIG